MALDAAGFSDGLVVLADVASKRVLPVCAPGRGPVSALAWIADGSYPAFATETGFAAVVDFGKRRAGRRRVRAVSEEPGGAAAVGGRAPWRCRCALGDGPAR